MSESELFLLSRILKNPRCRATLALLEVYPGEFLVMWVLDNDSGAFKADLDGYEDDE
jgi:hypothetical protein